MGIGEFADVGVDVGICMIGSFPQAKSAADEATKAATSSVGTRKKAEHLRNPLAARHRGYLPQSPRPSTY